MKNTKRTLSALFLTGTTIFGSLGLAATPAKADGAGAAIIGAIVGYGLYQAGKDDRNDHRDYRRDRYDRDRYERERYDNRYDRDRYDRDRYSYRYDNRDRDRYCDDGRDSRYSYGGYSSGGYSSGGYYGDSSRRSERHENYGGRDRR